MARSFDSSHMLDVAGQAGILRQELHDDAGKPDGSCVTSANLAKNGYKDNRAAAGRRGHACMRCMRAHIDAVASRLGVQCEYVSVHAARRRRRIVIVERLCRTCSQPCI